MRPRLIPMGLTPRSPHAGLIIMLRWHQHPSLNFALKMSDLALTATDSTENQTNMDVLEIKPKFNDTF